MSRAGLERSAEAAFAEARPAVFWTDRDEAPPASEPLAADTEADLVIIGAGFTGLWAALLAAEAEPAATIVVLEAGRIGSGASGRNGGFVAASLTHGLPHGARTWPGELGTLLRLGRANLVDIAAFVEKRGIDCDLRLCGKTSVAVAPHQVQELERQAGLYRQHSEDVELLDGEQVRADIASPSYIGGLRVRSGYGLVDPARLAWGLASVAQASGVRIHEHSKVIRLRGEGGAVRVTTASGSIICRRVVIATNAYPAPLRRLRPFIVPVYDYVLVTEPLGPERWASLGWSERQGVTDAGNFFHYYRPTADGRLLWGGYDALYHFGSRVHPSLEQNEASQRTLAGHFFETFPQLQGLRFTHRWGGAIDSTSRFTPLFGTALGGRVAYAVGYTGLGVASSRFGAQVALDLLAGDRTERTDLEMVRRRPWPFPPEPLRWLAVRLTQSELARQDRNEGRASLWLRLLDRLGMGFSS